MSTSQWKPDEDLITHNTTGMNLNPGDVDSDRTVTLDAGTNDIEMGGVVTFDGSGNIAHPTSETDDIIGVVGPESADKPDSEYTVHVFGYVVAVQLDDDGATDVSPGDVLAPSASYNGAFTDVSGGMAQAVDESGSATYTLYMNHPVALESGSGGTDADSNLDGDVVLAFYR